MCEGLSANLSPANSHSALSRVVLFDDCVALPGVRPVIFWSGKKVH